MKTFEVSLWVERGYSVTVKANSSDEAEDKALETYDYHGRVVHGDSGICHCIEQKPSDQVENFLFGEVQS
jgi:hypothetical protein